MRVTNKTLTKTFLNNLNTNLENMRKYQDQLSSGKEIRKPSDDPYKVVRSMDLNRLVERNESYLRNIEDSISWLNTTDTALGQIGDSLARIKDLMQTASNGTNSETELYAYKQEIIQRIEEIVQSGNTSFDGKYIFAGNKTTTKPFESTTAGGVISVSFSGDQNAITREISQGVTMDINVTGYDIMNIKDKDGNVVSNLGDVLSEVVQKLEAGDNTALSGELLDKVSDHFNNILRLRTTVGAKENRMESAKSKNEEETFNLTEVLSQTEDIDIAEKYMEYAVMATVYQASLMAGTKVLQPTLVDFLR